MSSDTRRTESVHPQRDSYLSWWKNESTYCEYKLNSASHAGVMKSFTDCRQHGLNAAEVCDLHLCFDDENTEAQLFLLRYHSLSFTFQNKSPVIPVYTA